MTDEISLAFDHPEARAAATADAVLDRICVRDYTVAVDIGAFQVERGVQQRVRFNVALEVAGHAAAQTDDVDQVLSYEAIVDAIDQQMAVERLNLLETLAERIAEQILSHPQAVRVFVRIEKLDRIPGTLGVEIMRSRRAARNVAVLQEAAAAVEIAQQPLVVFLPNSVLQGAALPAWLNGLENLSKPVLICLEQTGLPIPHAGNAQVDRRLGLLAIEQNAWVLAGKDPRCLVVASRTELDWAMKNRRLAIWAPSKIVLDAVARPKADAANPLDLAGWFAAEFSAEKLLVCGGYQGAETSDRLTVAVTPADLSAVGI